MFWTCVWVSCAFFFPNFLRAATTGQLVSFPKLPKPKPKDRRATRVCLLPHPTTRHGPIIYGSQSTSSSVHYVHYTLKHLPFLLSTALSGFLIPTTSSLLFPLSPSARLSVCIFLCVCGESSGIRWTRRSSQTDGLFSALNEIWQLEYAIHNLIYPPNWKAREELNTREGSAVCFADLCQLSYFKCFLCCVWSSRWAMYTVDSVMLRKLSQDVIEVICNDNSTQVRCFQGATH